MAGQTVKRQYEVEFKIDAAKLVEGQGYAVGEAAERLGISKANLTRWLRQYRQGKLVANHKQAQPTPEETEVKRLRQEVKRLEMEVAILKKAAVYFAKQTT